MYECHPVFSTPPDHVKVWRYLDLVKFVWMLAEDALYLPRADFLGDPHEGSLARINAERRDELTSSPGWKWAPGIDPDAPQRTLLVLGCFVSCWNMSEYESAALWATYGKSIAIESSVGRLKDSLRDPQPFYLGRVTYIDYEREEIPEGNGYYPIVYKRRYFEAEKELRVVVPGRNWDDEKGQWAPDPRHGVPLQADLRTLLSAVWVAPGESLLRKVVEALLNRFELDVPVQQSSLDSPPRF